MSPAGSAPSRTITRILSIVFNGIAVWPADFRKSESVDTSTDFPHEHFIFEPPQMRRHRAPHRIHR